MSSKRFFSSSNQNEESKVDENANSIIDQLKSEISGESNEPLAAEGLSKDLSNDSASSGEKFQEVLDKYFNEVDEGSEQDMEQKLNIENIE